MHPDFLLTVRLDAHRNMRWKKSSMLSGAQWYLSEISGRNTKVGCTCTFTLYLLHLIVIAHSPWGVSPSPCCF